MNRLQSIVSQILAEYHQMNKVCWLLGHKWYSKSPRHWTVCNRCGLSEYDDEFYAPSFAPYLLVRFSLFQDNLFRFMTRAAFVIKTSIVPETCPECGKVRYVAGREVGKHTDCDIPF